MLFKKIVKIILILAMILLSIGGFTYYKLKADIQEIAEEIKIDHIEVSTVREEEVQIEEGDPLNFLIIGTDGDNKNRGNDGSRSDSMIIATINPKLKSTKLLSIPRDALATIEGRDYPEKINHSFAYGGVALTVDTIQNYLQIPIDYYAVVNMSGLEAVIDAIGGVEVTSPLSFTFDGVKYKKGETRLLKGKEALGFARMRYDDPTGEVGRQERQRMVIMAIMKRMISPNFISYYPKLVEVAKNHIKTNFDLSTVLDIYPKYLPGLESVETLSFDHMEETMIDEIFYFHIPIESRQKISRQIRQQLELKIVKKEDFDDPLALMNYDKKKEASLQEQLQVTEAALDYYYQESPAPQAPTTSGQVTSPPTSQVPVTSQEAPVTPEVTQEIVTEPVIIEEIPEVVSPESATDGQDNE